MRGVPFPLKAINEALRAEMERIVNVNYPRTVEIRYPVENKFSFTYRKEAKYTELTQHHIIGKLKPFQDIFIWALRTMLSRITC